MGCTKSQGQYNFIHQDFREYLIADLPREEALWARRRNSRMLRPLLMSTNAGGSADATLGGAMGILYPSLGGESLVLNGANDTSRVEI